MMKLLIATALALTCLASGRAHAAGDIPEIFRIFDRMVFAKTIAEGCHASTPDKAGNFDKNFSTIRFTVFREIGKRNHYAPAFDIEDFLNKREKVMQEAGQRFLKEKGCNHSDATEIVKFHRFHEDWNPPQ